MPYESPGGKGSGLQNLRFYAENGILYPVPKKTLGALLDDSKTRTYHGRVGAGRRTAGRQGGARLTGRFAQELTVPVALQIIEDNPPGRPPEGPNKRNPF